MTSRLVRILLLLSVMYSSHFAYAQTSDQAYRAALEKASFQMIKSTVEFLATDQKTFPEIQAAQCDTCNSYEGLKAFTQQNKMLNADQLINDAKKRSVQYIVQDNQPKRALTELKAYLINKITVTGREHRKELAGYGAYERTLDNLITSGEREALGLSAPASESTVPAEVAAEPTSDSTDEVAANANRGTESEASAPSADKTTKSDWSTMGTITFILSLVSLGISLFLFNKTRRPQTSPREERFESQLAKLSDRVSKLEAGAGRPQQAGAQLAEKINALEQTVRQLEQQPTPPPAPSMPVSMTETPARPVEVATPAGPTPPPTPPVPASAEREMANQPTNRFRTQQGQSPQPRPTAFYGRTADLGDGFSVGSLMITPDRDTVFDIQLQSDVQAFYRVSENPDAQRLALSDPYSYLNDSCEYMTQPTPGSRIRTEQPGRLALQGDKWKIIEKAKISFYA